MVVACLQHAANRGSFRGKPVAEGGDCSPSGPDRLAQKTGFRRRKKREAGPRPVAFAAGGFGEAGGDGAENGNDFLRTAKAVQGASGSGRTVQGFAGRRDGRDHAGGGEG